jgi:hypothetical protein
MLSRASSNEGDKWLQLIEGFPMSQRSARARSGHDELMSLGSTQKRLRPWYQEEGSSEVGKWYLGYYVFDV